MESVIGLDVGFGWVKVTTENTSTKFRTLIAPFSRSGDSDIVPITFAGKEYVVGNDARFFPGIQSIPSITALLENLPILIKAAVAEVGIENPKEVTIVTGLPPVHKNLKSKTESIAEEVVKKAYVVPQGYGILKDTEDQINDSVLIIDVGFNTVDYLLAVRTDNGWKKARSNSLERSGVERAVSIFIERIAPEHPSVRKLVLGKRTMLFEKATMSLGEEIDLSQEKEAAIEEFAREIFQRLDEELDLDTLIKEVDSVVLAGGGAYLLKDRLNFPGSVKMIIPEEPEFSQSRGYYKAAKGVQE